jgi:hypothetical protein
MCIAAFMIIGWSLWGKEDVRVVSAAPESVTGSTSIHEKNAETYYELGMQKLEAKDYTLARTFFSYAISYNPKSDYYYRRSHSRFFIGDVTGAYDDAKMAFKLEPQNRFIQENLSRYSRLRDPNSCKAPDNYYDPPSRYPKVKSKDERLETHRSNIKDGGERRFVSDKKNEKLVVYGFPLSSCEDQRVTIGPENSEWERISIDSAFDQLSFVSTRPNRVMSFVEGEYRYFINYYHLGQQFSLGFPKSFCRDQRVWVGIDEEEIERISVDEGYRIMEQKKFLTD